MKNHPTANNLVPTRLLLVACSFLLLFMSGCIRPEPEPPPRVLIDSPPKSYKMLSAEFIDVESCERIVVRLKDNAQQITIRLIGVKPPDPAAEPERTEKALEYIQKVLSNSIEGLIYIEPEYEIELTKTGVQPAWVWSMDGPPFHRTMLNRQLVRFGYMDPAENPVSNRYDLKVIRPALEN